MDLPDSLLSDPLRLRIPVCSDVRPLREGNASAAQPLRLLRRTGIASHHQSEGLDVAEKVIVIDGMRYRVTEYLGWRQGVYVAEVVTAWGNRMAVRGQGSKVWRFWTVEDRIGGSITTNKGA